MELVQDVLSQIAGMPLWAAFLLVVVATFVSEDLTCIGAGLLAAGGDVSVAFAIVASGLGIFLGDLGLYWAGKVIGQPAIRKRPLSWLFSEDDVLSSEEWFRRRGPMVILLGRFVPGSRLPSYFAAGVLNVGFWRFSFYALLAVLIWAPLLVGGALLMGRGVLHYYQLYATHVLWVLIGAVLFLWISVRWVAPLFSYRGRRLLVSRVRRTVRWEFWPPPVFYAPVVAYVFYLAVKHRSLSLLTAVNPAVPGGGFVGESKIGILEGLRESSEFLAATRRIPLGGGTDAAMERLAEFLSDEGLDYPVVLKPDAGQRGSGVVVIRDDPGARAYFDRTRVETVAQEFVPGPEYGVFYYRFPEADSIGRIFSITEKHLPVVVGDGERTLEHLILDDDRAVCMAPVYLRNHLDRLWDVPAEGECVPLSEIGNHCRGAIFLDGAHLETPELLATFDRITRRFEGFFFGRYDVCASSEEDFRAGRNFKIIELNGGTSEATHIYDPDSSLLDAYRVLFEQWRILFAIAEKNRARGAPTVPWTSLVKSLLDYRQGARSHP